MHVRRCLAGVVLFFVRVDKTQKAAFHKAAFL